MYKRDLGILLVAAFAVYFTLQDEGTFAFRKAWYHHLDEDAGSLTAADVLPQPVVGDLNGDGEPEIIVATHEAKLRVLAPRPPGRSGDGFAPAKQLAEISLAQSGAAFSGSARAAAIAVGTLDTPAKEFVRPFPKQVIVVVTHGWHVLCFDHNLQLLWDRSIKEELPHHAAMSEVAIHISNHTIHKRDRGLVVVGASSRLGELGDGFGASLDDADPLDAELAAEREEARRRRSAKLAGFEELKDAKDGVDVSRHFSYYAWEGGAGSLRWKHEGKDFHRDAAELAEQLIPQHNYRLDAASLAGRHYGQASCREYRASVLRSMPHRWARRSDTRLALSHFRHHKAGRGAQRHRLGAPPEKLDVAHRGRTPSTRGQHGRVADNKVAATISKLASGAVSGAKGRPTAQHAAPASTEAEHLGHANVLVAHLQEGIEAIHLYTGRTICKLHLPAPGLHADINGDGVMDHIQAHGGQREDMSETGHRHLPACWGTVHSGLPPKTPLFNGTICRGNSAFAQHDFTEQAFGRELLAALEVAPPTALPVVGARGHVRRSRAHPVFANSRGEITAYDAHGKLQWQLTAGTSWTNAVGDTESHAVAPTLEAIPLRPGGAAVAVLAAGAHTAAVISEHGRLLDSLELPAPPLLPLLVVDYSFDRFTDIILTTRDGYYGFTQVRRIGGVPFGALVAFVIVGMVAVYASQQSTAGSRKRKGRSTDRTD